MHFGRVQGIAFPRQKVFREGLPSGSQGHEEPRNAACVFYYYNFFFNKSAVRCLLQRHGELHMQVLMATPICRCDYLLKEFSSFNLQYSLWSSLMQSVLLCKQKK